MADDNESPRPFRRERNLSNRNFKRGSRRRPSTDSYSSIDSNSVTQPTTPSTADATTTSSALQFSYSVNSEAEQAAFDMKSLNKMLPTAAADNHTTTTTTTTTTTANEEQVDDPSFLDVKQKVQHFETLQSDERIIFKVGKFNTRIFDNSSQNYRCNNPIDSRRSSSIMNTTSIDEVRSEDEIEDFSDYVEDDVDGVDSPSVVGDNEKIKVDETQYLISKNASALATMAAAAAATAAATAAECSARNVEKTNQRDSVDKMMTMPKLTSEELKNIELQSSSDGSAKSFPRNFRSKSRPKTEVISTTNPRVVGKYNSLYETSNNNSVDLEEEEPEMRNKSDKFIQPILEELIKTEETYVENLYKGIKNYGKIFERNDLPMGLRGKKYVLLGNIESLAEFHRDEFLPMLHRNRRDLKRLFDDFQIFIDQNCFYGYVIFTMNKQRSLKLCDVYKNYFKLIQSELDDKLGINSFLVQPIQRMARYPLLLQQFISTLFKNRDFIMKPLIESCCRLEKKVRTLLTTTNESEVINDIVDCNEFNVFYQGRFRKVSEFNVCDYTLKRTYRAKVFIFDKCIIYTEIKGKNLVFHGRYPCEHIGVVAKNKSFTLFYERRKQQECDFMGEQLLVDTWLELIREMVNTFVAEERMKLQDRYSRENDHLHRKPVGLSLYRDSNRFSSDSGIGNIWVMPKPEAELEAVGNRTTWYAVS